MGTRALVGLCRRVTKPGNQLVNTTNSMKTLLISTVLFLGFLAYATASLLPTQMALPPADSATYTLTVNVANLARHTGTLYVGLDNSDATFNKESYRKTRIEIPATGDVQVSFAGVPAGRYAIRVFQDLNTNQKLDFSGSLPKEPFGFSNVKMLMGPPTFNQCAFDVNTAKTITVQLIGE